MPDKKKAEPIGLVDQQTTNLQELIEATQALQHTNRLTGAYELQRLTVAASPCRCPRCGDFSPSLMTAFATMCSQCLADFRAYDQAKYPKGFNWFIDLVQRLQKKDPK